MASDPSIYAQLGQGVVQPANQLTQAMQGAQVGSALLQLQQLQSQKAAGQAFQASINPDGTTNQAALMKNLAANPAAAMSAQTSGQAGQTLSTSEYAQHMTRLNYAASGAASLLSQPGGATMPAIKQYFDNAVADGHVLPQDEAQLLGAFGSDPAQNAAVIKQRLQQNVAAQTALTNNIAGTATLQNGQQIEGAQVAPIGSPSAGAITPVGPTTQIYPSRAELAARISGPVGPQGQQTQVPAGSVMPPSLSGPAGAGLPTPLVGPGGPGAFGTGRYSSSGAAPGQGNGYAQNPPASAAPPAPTGVVTTGLGPAQTGALAASGPASVSAAQPLIDAGTAAPGRLATLNTMLSDAQNFVSGPGSDEEKKAGALLQRYLPGVAPAFGASAGKIAASESFDKMAAQIANAQGAGSDARYSGIVAANPTSHLSQAGVNIILHQLQGNEDANQARAAAYNQYVQKNGPDSYQNFAATVLPHFDPRVFQLNRMTPAERATALSGPAGKDVLQSYKNALAKGIIALPGQAPNGQ